MKHYAAFNENGERITTYIPGVNCEAPPDDAVLISEEEQEQYVTNDYIKGADGKPVLKPVHVPTEAELKQQQIDYLNKHYPERLSGILKAIDQAKALGNPVDSLQVKYQQTFQEYRAKMAELVGA